MTVQYRSQRPPTFTTSGAQNDVEVVHAVALRRSSSGTGERPRLVQLTRSALASVSSRPVAAEYQRSPSVQTVGSDQLRRMTGFSKRAPSVVCRITAFDDAG